MFYDKFKNNEFIQKLNKILQSKLMVVFIIFLATISNVFGLEIPIYYIFALLIVLTTFFGEDMLPLFPISCCGYMTFSKKSNPLGATSPTFSKTSNIIHLSIIVGIIFIVVVSRIIYDVIKHPERRIKPKLLSGFLLLLITSLLGGIFTKYYGIKTIFFGLLQSIAITFSYFIFYYTVDWKKVSKNYFPFLLMCLGFLIVIECFNMYIDANMFNSSTPFSRGNLFTGWGIYNNIALICVITLPAPFYYINTKEQKWIFVVISLIFYINILLLQSRNGILFGTIIFITNVIYTLYKQKNKEVIITYALSLIIGIALIFILKVDFNKIYASLKERGLYSADRTQLYKTGLKNFIKHPIFGEGFYAYKGYVWNFANNTNNFLPARYHNTYIQQLASCGILGLIAYIYHRYQTIKLLQVSKRDTALFTLSCSLLGFILLSLLDCHFHNLGPGLIYSAILLILEKVYAFEKVNS